MGSAVHATGGETRLGLSATAAAAVLYGVVVLLGLGPASPAALGTDDGLSTPVVHVPHDSAVSGPVQRLPQVSPGPARHHVQRPDVGGVLESAPSTLTQEGSTPTDTPEPDAMPPHPSPTHPAPSALPATKLPVLAVAIPDVTVPAVEVPQLPTLPTTPSLPSLPSLPSPPSVPLP